MIHLKNFIIEVVSFFIARARARLYIYLPVVIPAKAGIQGVHRFLLKTKTLDSGFRRNDEFGLVHSTGLMKIFFITGFLILGSTAVLSAKPQKNSEPKNETSRVSDAKSISSLKSNDEEIKQATLNSIRKKDVFVSGKDLQGIRDSETNPEMRKKINTTVTHMDSPDVLEILFETLQSDPDERVRESAVRDLSRYVQNPRVSTELANIFKSDGSIRVKKACILVLGLANTDEAFAALEEASEDGDASLRVQAAQSLSINPHKKASKILRKLRRDKDPHVKAAASKKNL